MARYQDTRVKPALERDVHRFYNLLAELAEVEKRNGINVLVYVGYPSKLFVEAGINPRYYSPIRKILGETKSVTVERVGNRATASVWVLNHKPPPVENWPKDLTGAAVSATMRGEFERRIAALEEWRESITGGGLNIKEALRDFEVRLSKLEGRKE
jgi:hypothetical protein